MHAAAKAPHCVRLHVPASCSASRQSQQLECLARLPLCSGMTDSRHYIPLARGRVYRFQPQRFTRQSLASVHGVDERIAGAARGSVARCADGCGTACPDLCPGGRMPRAVLPEVGLLGTGLDVPPAAPYHATCSAGMPLSQSRCLATAPSVCAVDDYLRGIGFYVRFYQRASADLGQEEAAAEGAAAQQAAAAAQE